MLLVLPILMAFSASAVLLSGNGINAAAVIPGVQSASAKIIGGVEARPGEFPWIVSIQLDDFNDHERTRVGPGASNVKDWLCVGTIIGTTGILTAAHCVKDFPNDEIKVIAGAHNISAHEPTQQTVRVIRKYVHEGYTGVNGTLRNDIALLIVEELNFNDYVTSVRLPPPGHEPNGTCVITGWGQTLSGGTTDTLHKADIPIVSTQNCYKAYGNILDPESQICAGRWGVGGVDACLFDTGGPLLCNDLGYSYIAGIVSWGFSCALPDYPGVYTKVSRYVDWVQVPR